MDLKGGPKTHGQSDRLRAPGAIGMTTTPDVYLKEKEWQDVWVMRELPFRDYRLWK